jgi:hypothetical protein
MTTSLLETSARATSVRFTDDELVVSLSDARTLSVPLAWFPRLFHASISERAEWRLIGDGEGIHWEAVDEDLSIAGLLRGESATGVTHVRSEAATAAAFKSQLRTKRGGTMSAKKRELIEPHADDKSDVKRSAKKK